MPKYFKEFSITGVANDTAYDEGLESTETEKRKVTHVLVNVGAHVGNTLEFWLERERVATIPDYLVDTEANSATTNTMVSTTKINRIEVDFEIPTGQRFKAAIRCGANPQNFYGAYEYIKV